MSSTVLEQVTADIRRNIVASTQSFLKHFSGRVMVAAYGKNALPVEGCFDDDARLIAALNDLNQSGRYDGVYVTLNEFSLVNAPPLWKLSPNELMPVVKGNSLESRHIAKRRWVLVDFDRCGDLKKAGPATNAEKEHLYNQARRALVWLTMNGIPQAHHIVFADSGNGYHILIAVDLPNDEASDSLVRRFLEALALKFNDQICEIDTSVSDARRVTRAYGSWNRKGTQTALQYDGQARPVNLADYRPHRRSRIIEIDPNFRGPVTREGLDKIIAAIAMKPAQVLEAAPGPGVEADLLTWAENFGQQLKPDGAGRWAVSNPACAGRHGGKHPHTTATRLMVVEGRFGFKCHHDSCSELTWKDYRQMVEAGHDPYYFPWEGEEAEAEPPQPAVSYPTQVWNGTLYGEFASRCSEGNFIPPEFAIEALKTVTGAVVGDRLSGEKYHEGMNARQYLCIICEIGVGKDTSINRALEFARAAKLLFDHALDFKGSIGAQLNNAASEPALYRAADKCEQLLLKPEEFDQLLSKTRTENSGQALMALLRGLFDRPFITGSTTEQRRATPSKCCLSLITSTQPPTFKQLISKHGGLGAGFGSRMTLIHSSETRTTALLDTPQLSDLRIRWQEKVKKLEKERFEVQIGVEAARLLRDWHTRVQKPLAEGQASTAKREAFTRLNILVLRNALHMAWLAEEHVVSPETMQRALRLGEYQLAVRQQLFGVPVENTQAGIEQDIKDFLRLRGRSSKRVIQKGVHYEKYGVWLFKQALQNLVNDGQVLEFPGKRKDQRFYALRKEEDSV